MPSNVARRDELEQTFQELETPHSVILDDTVNKYIPTMGRGFTSQAYCILEETITESQLPEYSFRTGTEQGMSLVLTLREEWAA